MCHHSPWSGFRSGLGLVPRNLRGQTCLPNPSMLGEYVLLSRRPARPSSGPHPALIQPSPDPHPRACPAGLRGPHPRPGPRHRPAVARHHPGPATHCVDTAAHSTKPRPGPDAASWSRGTIQVPAAASTLPETASSTLPPHLPPPFTWPRWLDQAWRHPGPDAASSTIAETLTCPSLPRVRIGR
jgi:hypothetical protein